MTPSPSYPLFLIYFPPFLFLLLIHCCSVFPPCVPQNSQFFSDFTSSKHRVPTGTLINATELVKCCEMNSTNFCAASLTQSIKSPFYPPGSSKCSINRIAVQWWHLSFLKWSSHSGRTISDLRKNWEWQKVCKGVLYHLGKALFLLQNKTGILYSSTLESVSTKQCLALALSR